MKTALLIILGIIILIVLVWGFMNMYNKSDLVKSLFLMQTMRKHGPDSLFTLNLLQEILTDVLKKRGLNVTDCSIVHEMGYKFHAIVTIDGEEHEMSVIADKSGELHYKIIE